MAATANSSSSADFDFEQHVKTRVWLKDGGDGVKKDPKFRVIVCRHWLDGLCLNGEEACTFLHRLDRTKMYACKYGTLCKIKNCPLKHTEQQEIHECIFYRQGFCCNGPGCIRRHLKRTPEELPTDASFEQCVVPMGPNASKQRKNSQPNDNFKVSLCSNWLQNGSCHFNDTCHFAHGEEEINDSNQGGDVTVDIVAIHDPTRFDLTAVPNVPFQAERLAYFLFQAPDLRALDVSRRRGIWAVPVRLAAEINAALKSCDHVVAFFSVRALRGVYGLVKILDKIPPAIPGSALTPEFPIKWMRTFRVPLRSVAQLKVGQGMFVGKMLSDGRFDEKTNSGAHMMLVSYRKPEWDWGNELAKAGTPVAETSAEAQQFADAFGDTPADPNMLFAPDWHDKVALNSVSFDRAVARTKGQQSLMAAGDAGAAGGVVEFYTGDNPGFIFMAPTSEVVREMLFRRLIGVPEAMRDIIIHPGAPLFLADMSQCMLLGACPSLSLLLFLHFVVSLYAPLIAPPPTTTGIFHADSPVSENIDPRAFAPWDGQPSLLPIQLRVTVVVDAQPICFMQDTELMEVFKETGFVAGPISLKQTKALAQLFATRTGVQGAGGGIKNLPGQPAAPVTHATLYRPPFKNIAVVPIDIEGDVYQIKKRVLGVNAATVLQIVEELGTKNSIRIRMRGIGSGYQEGPLAQEIQEPLHFNVSAETEDLLNAVVAKVRALIERARADMQQQQ